MDHDPKIELPPGTMLIKAPSPDEQGPFVIINKSDFDPDTQQEYIPPRPTKSQDDTRLPPTASGDGKSKAK